MAAEPREGRLSPKPVGSPSSTHVPRHRFRRWHRNEADAPSEEITRYRTPVQVCSRGCEYTELARRYVHACTDFWGRAALHVGHTFETTNCPTCGARLMERCARCKGDIFAPVADRCQFCGVPHPWAAERRSGTEQPKIRQWLPGEGVSDSAKFIYHARLGDLWVIEADVVRLDVEAIVSNDDVDGRMWTEVAHAIKQAGGEEVQRLAREEAPRRLGQAWVTASGALPFEGIIHVASMNRRGEQSVETMEACLAAALECALARRFRSVGIAAIGSGPKAIDLTTWLGTFGRTVVNQLYDPPAGSRAMQPLSIVLALYEPVDFSKAVEILERAVRDAETAARERAEREPASRGGW